MSCHWACARSTSTWISLCIQGLISYSTPKWLGGHTRYRWPHGRGRGPAGGSATDEALGEIADEQADVRHDPERLVTAAVGQFRDDRLVDVDAVGLDTGLEHVADGDGVEGGGQHERDVDVADVTPHGVLGHDDVGDGVGKRPVVADGAGQDERHI